VNAQRGDKSSYQKLVVDSGYIKAEDLK